MATVTSGACGPGGTGGVRLDVGVTTLVTADRPGDTFYEVHAAADVGTPGRLLVGSIVFPGDSGFIDTAVYQSTDGGRSWTPTLDGPALRHTGDPALAFGPEGVAYYTASHIPPDGGERTMLFFASPDGGRTWTDSTHFTYTDRQYVTVDAGGGPQHGRIYVNGSNRIPREVSDFVLFWSDDGGRSFRGPNTRTGFASFTAESMGNSVVLSDGTLVGVFAETVEGRSVLRAIRSIDGGRTLSDAVTIEDFVPGGSRKGDHNNVNAQPVLAVDAGDGPFRDRMYVVWPDRRTGRSRIVLSVSSDGGGSWSGARVVDDGPVSDSSDALMPAVAVSRDGVVGISWYDRRRHPDNLGWNVRFTASADGGETFASSVEVSPEGTTFGRGTPWTALRSTVSRTSGGFTLSVGLNTFTFLGGDTAGLVADAAGVFHAVWVDNHTGVPQVWTAPVEVERGGPAARALPVAGTPPHATGDPRADGAASPAIAAPPGPALPVGGRDVSEAVALVVTRATHERDGEILTLTAHLENRSSLPLSGELILRAGRPEGELGEPVVTNADNAEPGDGAEWSFGAGNLEPGAASEDRVVRFTLEELRPFRAGRRVRMGLLELPVRVYVRP